MFSLSPAVALTLSHRDTDPNVIGNVQPAVNAILLVMKISASIDALMP
jgi:hypothetical protein